MTSVTAKDAVTETKGPTDPKTPEPKPVPVADADTSKGSETVEELVLTDPRELLIRKPMPFKQHTATRVDGKKIKFLVQGLSYLEKQAIDTRSRMRRQADEEAVQRGDLDQPRPSLWAPEIAVTAMCKPNGQRVYKDEEIRGAALALAEQLPDGELQAIADTVLEASGWGADSAMQAGKASRKTRAIG